jgi:hypothetical protein
LAGKGSGARLAEDELWAGHSRFLAFWEAAVTIGLILCAVITILTTLGIIIVLSAQTPSRRNSGSFRYSGAR